MLLSFARSESHAPTLQMLQNSVCKHQGLKQNVYTMHNTEHYIHLLAKVGWPHVPRILSNAAPALAS